MASDDPSKKPRAGDLTHSQLPLAVGQRLHPGVPLYNMAFAFVFPEALDPERFRGAWHRVAEAADALRTRLVELPGGGLRRAQPGDADERGTVPGTRVSGPPGAKGRLDEAAFLRWARERCARPLDLAGPLVDSVLVPLADGGTGWYLNQHHLVADAASTRLVYRLVAEQMKREESAPEPLDLPSYYDAHARQRASVSDAARASAEAFWIERRRRAGRSVPLYGADRAHGALSTHSVRHTLELGAERTAALERLARQPGFASLSPDLSRFALLATLVSAWLHLVSGRREVGFDAPVAGRPSAEAKATPGVFLEIFPFAATLRPGDTFRDLGVRCLEEAMAFLRHALPGLSASPSSAPADSNPASTNPSGESATGNVVLNFLPGSFGELAGQRPRTVEWLHPNHGDAVHALRVQVHDFAGRGALTLHFDWNEKEAPEPAQRRSLRHFEALLDAALADPDREIATVDLRTEGERRRLARFNDSGWQGADPRRPLPDRTVPDRTVLDLFREQVERTPERTALRRVVPDGPGDEEADPDLAEELSFAELHRRVESLAAALVRRGVEPGDRVAVDGRRSVRSVVALLAVLRARAAYVPVDPSYPEARRQHVLRDAGVKLFLGGADDDSHSPGTPEESPSLDPPTLDDLAYLIYTSGSTGPPKGVLVGHDGLADYVTWASRRYVRGDRLTYPLFTSLSFDLTVTSLFLPLVTGGTLEIYPQGDGPVDRAVLDVVRRNAVDFIKLTPSHLSLLRRAGLDETSKIRRMVVGGEDLPAELAAAVSSQLADLVEIHNEYGPTEAVVGCVVHRFDPAVDREGSVPIGAPADHVEVEVRNGAGVPVPEGVPGELWIARHGLARGYHGRDELTAERFVPDGSPAASRRHYRSGDLVRFVRPGVLTFLGRVDRQVKVSGFRVEPGEIEAALLRHPAVAACRVVARRRRTLRAADPAAVTAPEGPAVRHCLRCGLPSNYPRATLGDDGVCSVCRSYERVREHAQAYFRTLDDLRTIFHETRPTGDSGPDPDTGPARDVGPAYDAMVLYSGGKDSTYALCRLAEMDLRILAFTLDNGYISDGAKANIRRVTSELGVDVEFATTPAMDAIFRDSLARFSNVCNGCFKTIYTLAMRRAHELGIPVIVTGLSRGQMFETRLTEEMFRDGRVRPEEVDAAVLASRKAYHRADDEVSRSLDVRLFRDDRIFEEVRIVDFYRYCDASLEEMYAYLRRNVPWVRPEDTGRSTNCLINDAGIWVHKAERGFHNYALPYSWDVRMGHKTRDEALDELDDEIDEAQVRRMLAEVGYLDSPDAARPRPGDETVSLEAFVVLESRRPDGTPSVGDLRLHLAEHLPSPWVPARLHLVEGLPLTAHGKVDDEALAALGAARRPASGAAGGAGREPEPPQGPVEEFLADLWRRELAVERVDAGDSFFELGGTSLLAMRVMLRLCEEFDIDVPLESVFSYPTLRGLSRVAEDRILADAEAL